MLANGLYVYLLLRSHPRCATFPDESIARNLICASLGAHSDSTMISELVSHSSHQSPRAVCSIVPDDLSMEITRFPHSQVANSWRFRDSHEIYLVGGLVAINFIFPLILGCIHHPNGRSYFSEGWPWPTNQIWNPMDLPMTEPPPPGGASPGAGPHGGAQRHAPAGRRVGAANVWEMLGKWIINW